MYLPPNASLCVCICVPSPHLVRHMNADCVWVAATCWLSLTTNVSFLNSHLKNEETEGQTGLVTAQGHGGYKYSSWEPELAFLNQGSLFFQILHDALGHGTHCSNSEYVTEENHINSSSKQL